MNPNLIYVSRQCRIEASRRTNVWTTIYFPTHTGQICTPLRQEFVLLSDTLGVSALVAALNSPTLGGSTESCVTWSRSALHGSRARWFVLFSLLLSSLTPPAAPHLSPARRFGGKGMYSRAARQTCLVRDGGTHTLGRLNLPHPDHPSHVDDGA